MIILTLLVLGLIFGSFVTAFTWRLHEGKDFVAGRSECEACGHKLAATDLVPVFSWLFLGGKCRYCKKYIGWHNPAIELMTALLFVGSYQFWPYLLNTWQSVAVFIVWLCCLVLLMALIVYDFKWFILPNTIVLPLVVLGLVMALLQQSVLGGTSVVGFATYIMLGASVIGGGYGVLYYLSKGKWVGFGDVKLGVFIGIVLGWRLALLCLLLANLVSFVYVIPGLLSKKLNRQSRIPFGPFLITGLILAMLFGEEIINWYLSLLI